LLPLFGFLSKPGRKSFLIDHSSGKPEHSKRFATSFASAIVLTI
jgi:hypothetical protein